MGKPGNRRRTRERADLVSAIRDLKPVIEELQRYSFIESDSLIEHVGREFGRGIAQRMICDDFQCLNNEMPDLFRNLGLGKLEFIGSDSSDVLMARVRMPYATGSWGSLCQGVLSGILDHRLNCHVEIVRAERAGNRGIVFEIRTPTDDVSK